MNRRTLPSPPLLYTCAPRRALPRNGPVCHPLGRRFQTIAASRRIGGAEVHPVLGRVVVEGQQHVEVVGDFGDHHSTRHAWIVICEAVRPACQGPPAGSFVPPALRRHLSQEVREVSSEVLDRRPLT
jgi:hypothetical protein